LVSPSVSNQVLATEFKRTGDVRYLHRFFAQNQGLIHKDFSGYQRDWVQGQGWIHLVAAAASWEPGKALLTTHWIKRMKWKMQNEWLREDSLVVPAHRDLRTFDDRGKAMRNRSVEITDSDHSAAHDPNSGQAEYLHPRQRKLSGTQDCAASLED